jgi:hypothetical protein
VVPIIIYNVLVVAGATTEADFSPKQTNYQVATRYTRMPVAILRNIGTRVGVGKLLVRSLPYKLDPYGSHTNLRFLNAHNVIKHFVWYSFYLLVYRILMPFSRRFVCIYNICRTW